MSKTEIRPGVVPGGLPAGDKAGKAGLHANLALIHSGLVALTSVIGDVEAQLEMERQDDPPIPGPLTTDQMATNGVALVTSALTRLEGILVKTAKGH